MYLLIFLNFLYDFHTENIQTHDLHILPLQFIGFILSSPIANTSYDSRSVQNFEGFLFMFVINSFIRIFYTTIPTYHVQFSIIHREIHNGVYSLSAYYVSELIVMVHDSDNARRSTETKTRRHFSGGVDNDKNVTIQHHSVRRRRFPMGWLGAIRVLRGGPYRFVIRCLMICWLFARFTNISIVYLPYNINNSIRYENYGRNAEVFNYCCHRRNFAVGMFYQNGIRFCVRVVLRLLVHVYKRRIHVTPVNSVET